MCPPCSDRGWEESEPLYWPSPLEDLPLPRGCLCGRVGHCLPEPLPSPSLWLLFWHLLKVPSVSFTLRGVSRGDQSPGSPHCCLTPHTAAWLLSWGDWPVILVPPSDPRSCCCTKGLSESEPSAPPGTPWAGQPSRHLPRALWLRPSHTFLPDSQEPTSWSHTV